MRENVLQKLDKQLETLEKEIAIVGKICKFCMHYGRSVDKPGYCPMIRATPKSPEQPCCSWFTFRNTRELIEILRKDETLDFKAKSEEKARIWQQAYDRRNPRKPETDDPIEEPEETDSMEVEE